MTSRLRARPRRRRALVVGTGLIGGSIALGLRRRGWHVSGVDADENRLREALDGGVVDATGDDPEAEVVFVAVPASAVAGEVGRLLADSSRRNDAVVTDVCGVKTAIVAEADHARFIGGHPMAGSEQVGLHGADPDLFEGAVWVLTPTAATDLAAFDRLKGVVMSLGADVLVLSAADHDRLVAVVSHVPHLVAATLMNAASAGATQDGTLLRLAAGGFRDMTRVAAGHPGIWPDICAENAQPIVESLDALVSDLQAIRDRVAAQDRPSAPRRPAGGQRSTAEPPGPHCPTRPFGRDAHPRVRPRRRPRRDHRAGGRRRHRYLRHRDCALDRGPSRGVLILVVDGADAEALAAAVEASGYRCVVEHLSRRRRAFSSWTAVCRAGARFVPRARSRSRTGRCSSARWPREPRRSAGSPTAPMWRPRWPPWQRWGQRWSGAPTGAWPSTAGAPACTSRAARSTAATRAPPCACWPAWWRASPGRPSWRATPRSRRGRWTAVAEPLGQMGARVEGHGERCQPPLRVHGGALHGIDWTSKVASAQVKSAILLAGLSASGITTVREAVTTRTHTEEMLAEAGADITVEPWGEGRVVHVRASVLRPVDRTVPGDPSASAFFAVAGCVVPGSAVEVAGVYSGPARLGYVSVLQRMGAAVTLVPGEPGTTTIRAEAGPLRATQVRAAEIPSLDEVPALAVAAAVADGTTVFTEVGELRVKEVDRLAAIAAMVEAFGAAGADRGRHARRHRCRGPTTGRPLRQRG